MLSLLSSNNGGDNFTETTVNGGGFPKYMYSQDQPRITLNSIDNVEIFERPESKREAIIKRWKSKLGLLKIEERFKNALMSTCPNLNVNTNKSQSKSSLIYDQLDEPAAKSNLDASNKLSKAYVGNVFQVKKTKLKLKKFSVDSDDDSDKEEILADNSEHDNQQGKVYLNLLSPKVLASKMP